MLAMNQVCRRELTETEDPTVFPDVTKRDLGVLSVLLAVMRRLDMVGVRLVFLSRHGEKVKGLN